MDARADTGAANLAANLRFVGRSAARAWHGLVARQPTVAKYYLRTIGSLVRPLPDGLNKHRLVNTLRGTEWPDITLPDQSVRLGMRYDVRLVPHVGEFDFEALFFRGLAYEREVFALLENRLDQYDAIVEIGANVGVYTTYFAQACNERQAIFAFEPSRKAFERLKENLALNGAARVQPFNLAVTDKPGLVSFFEPAGHLTNGSLSREFATFFSKDIQTSTVEAVDGSFLAQLLAPYRRLLFKIDVEGAEADVLRGLAPLITTVHPDLIVEVLEGFESTLNALDFITSQYRLLNITSAGLTERTHFAADGRHRDYLLVPRQATRS